MEQIAMKMCAVRSLSGIGVPDDGWGVVPIAIVALHEGTQFTLEAVLGHVRGRVAKYKLPRAAVVVDDLPRTASGKPRKVELRERFRSPPVRVQET